MRMIRVIMASFIMSVAGLLMMPILFAVMVIGSAGKFAEWLVEEPKEV